MGPLTPVTSVSRPLRLWRRGQSVVVRSSQSLATRVYTPVGITISKHFDWRLRRHQPNSASPQRGRSEVSGARRAERASAAGARGRTNKIAGVLITAIPFGSAARRCSWENGIFCYQMTVLIEVLCAEPSCRGPSPDAFSLRRPRTNDGEAYLIWRSLLPRRR